MKSGKGEKRDMSKEEQLAMDSDTAISEIYNCNKKVGTQQTEYCRCCNSTNCVERMRLLLDRDLEQRHLQVRFFLTQKMFFVL